MKEKHEKTGSSHLIVTHIPFMTWKCGRAVKISPPCIKFPPIIMIMLISPAAAQKQRRIYPSALGKIVTYKKVPTVDRGRVRLAAMGSIGTMDFEPLYK